MGKQFSHIYLFVRTLSTVVRETGQGNLPLCPHGQLAFHQAGGHFSPASRPSLLPHLEKRSTLHLQLHRSGITKVNQEFCVYTLRSRLRGRDRSSPLKNMAKQFSHICTLHVPCPLTLRSGKLLPSVSPRSMGIYTPTHRAKYSQMHALCCQ
jgi:hypothetical protein